MSEETTVVNAEQQAAPAVDNLTQHFQNSIWGDGNPLPNTQAAETTVTNESAAAETVADATKTNEEVLDPNTYLKTKWGWETEEQADNEIKELREKATKGFEYKNEESKTIAEYINEGKEDDLYQFLDTKRKVQKLSTADLSDKNVAAELVKFGIQKDNPNLSADEVEFLFNEKYSLPAKPVKNDIDDDDEYEAKVNSWQTQVSNIEKRLVIEAKMNQPKLAQLSNELVLPKINKEATANQSQPTPEEKAEFEKAKELFLQSAKQTVDGFSGFTTQVKDKDVDYSVSYTPSVDERKLLSENLNKLAESGFDANTLFAERWYDVNTKTFKIDQMTKDLSRIFIGENSDKKLAADAANKRLETYLAEKKNVKFSQGNEGSTFSPESKTKSEKLAEQFFGSN